LKRLKEFYEAEHPQTKNGGDRKSDEIRKRIPFSDSTSFTKDTAAKTNKSATTIQEEVQVASRIPEKVQTLIKDLPVADLNLS
jgi:ParB family chromosome partitioning protein